MRETLLESSDSSSETRLVANLYSAGNRNVETTISTVARINRLKGLAIAAALVFYIDRYLISADILYRPWQSPGHMFSNELWVE